MTEIYNELLEFSIKEAAKYDMEVFMHDSYVLYGFVVTVKKYDVYKSILIPYKNLFAFDIDRIKFDIGIMMREFSDNLDECIVLKGR